MLRGIYGDPERYRQTYWSRFPGMYFAGDGAKRDEDGYLWLLGRVDDVMNVAGHRISTTEVESALVDHRSVAEAAVVGKNDAITGQAIFAFVILQAGQEPSDELAIQLREHVAYVIGPIARPKFLMFVPDLPKTRSGKIMRRLLRDIAEGRTLGDTTTLADAAVVGHDPREHRQGRGGVSVPFGFLKRSKPDDPAAALRDGAAARSHRGLHRGAGARRPVHGAHGGLAAARPDADHRPAVGRAQSARGDRDHGRQLGSARRPARALTRRPGLKTVDPYDLILVTAGEDSLPPLTDTERAALKVHKVAYDVGLEVPPFRVVGTVYLHPGAEPDGLLGRSTEMFVPVVDAVARLGEVVVSDPDIEVILVNRFYLRGVAQVDKRTGEPHTAMPGGPLGGTSWQDQSR